MCDPHISNVYVVILTTELGCYLFHFYTMSLIFLFIKLLKQEAPSVNLTVKLPWDITQLTAAMVISCRYFKTTVVVAQREEPAGSSLCLRTKFMSQFHSGRFIKISSKLLFIYIRTHTINQLIIRDKLKKNVKRIKVLCVLRLKVHPDPVTPPLHFPTPNTTLSDATVCVAQTTTRTTRISTSNKLPPPSPACFINPSLIWRNVSELKEKRKCSKSLSQKSPQLLGKVWDTHEHISPLPERWKSMSVKWHGNGGGGAKNIVGVGQLQRRGCISGQWGCRKQLSQWHGPWFPRPGSKRVCLSVTAQTIWETHRRSKSPRVLTHTLLLEMAHWRRTLCGRTHFSVWRLNKAAQQTWWVLLPLHQLRLQTFTSKCCFHFIQNER